MTGTTKTLLLSTGLLLASTAVAQPRAEACFFWNDFEGEDALAGWDLGPTVERRTPDGQGLGLYVPAWNTGDAGSANSAGYFPVPDSPVGNRFAMANDAAEPCNCGMQDISLTSPVIDLSGRTGTALEFRAFNEGLFNAGPAVVEVSTEEGSWATLFEIPEVPGVWQRVFVDMSAHDGAASLKLRFRWSDGDTWAGGFAVDDICLAERVTNDLVVRTVHLGLSTASPYEIGDQRLRYSQLPLSQTAPVTLGIQIKNGGTAVLENIQFTSMIELNGVPYGPFTSTSVDLLAPGEEREIAIATEWTPEEPGLATIQVSGSTAVPDDLPEDNSTEGAVRFTGSGWNDGYGAMSCEHGAPTGSIGGASGFIALNRLEVVASGDKAYGASIVYGHGTEVGTTVRAILMDANFNTIDTSMRRVLDQSDIDAIEVGSPIFESFHLQGTLDPGDYHVGIQHLNPEGTGSLFVLVGGTQAPGRSIIMEGDQFLLTPLYSVPFIRLHLSEVPVGLEEPPQYAQTLEVFPNPASDSFTFIVPPGNSTNYWSLTDPMGRIILSGYLDHRTPGGSIVISTNALSNGIYHLSLLGNGSKRHGTVIIAR